MPMVGGKKFPYTKAGKAAAMKATKGKDPKPPREDVYGKPDRVNVWGKRDLVDVYPDPKRAERKPRVAPKPERRPVDERRAVRRRG